MQEVALDNADITRSPEYGLRVGMRISTIASGGSHFVVGSKGGLLYSSSPAKLRVVMAAYKSILIVDRFMAILPVSVLRATRLKVIKLLFILNTGQST